MRGRQFPGILDDKFIVINVLCLVLNINLDMYHVLSFLFRVLDPCQHQSLSLVCISASDSLLIGSLHMTKRPESSYYAYTHDNNIAFTCLNITLNDKTTIK